MFDVYLMIDWSGRGTLSPVTPAEDAIWIGERARDGGALETYRRGRAEAARDLRARLVGHVAAGRRVLVGFDFPYGFPAGLAAALGLDGAAPWRAVWDHLGEIVTDDDDNANNRFGAAASMNREIGGGPGPFWGCPAGEVRPELTASTTGVFTFPFPARGGRLARLRRTESRTPGVQEAWKLMYAGSVGSQALLGIPRVRALRDDPGLARISAVWPFETGFTRTPVGGRGPAVLHAEIWPGIVDPAALAAEVSTGAVRDRAQVRLMCRWAAERDEAGTLADRFAQPAGLADEDVGVVVAEEGWILS